ncbi:hypothetical protein Bca4012_002847 [Brassica carinata]|uniref:RRM domain-containing protein n=2 Tax=Brassica TaxID=3705 RepID=A0A0D3B7D3_BRAOL|nr:PREDICTED: cold-inducible RNA-binding protein isoform X1 [Brassica oleracea var. oleracea]KAG2295734.1 hypothetical protein Bca52824_042403 [Brassica carinata]
MLNHLLYRSHTPSLLFSRTFSSSSTLFVKGISFSSTEETLTQAFSQYGRVLGVDVVMDEVRCRPKGFAYVTFSSKEEAAKALLELNGQLVDGRVVILDTTKAVKQNRPDSKPKHADAVEEVPNSQHVVTPES